MVNLFFEIKQKKLKENFVVECLYSKENRYISIIFFIYSVMFCSVFCTMMMLYFEA